MQNVYITEIRINKVRHLENVDIKLSENELKHLILTGKNGSGKTSLLEAIREITWRMQMITTTGRENYADIIYAQKYCKENKINSIDISYSQYKFRPIDAIYVYVPARRSNFELPKAIASVKIKDKTKIDKNKSIDFLKYILSLDYQLYGAKTDNNKKLEADLNRWFENFASALKEIYSCVDLKLKRDTKNLSFIIEIPGHEPFGLHEMADGYAAFLEIYMELLMRFEDSEAVVNYEQSAIVMIDELEAHLHVELQKRALPFLVKMFPNVQFIVATHSPFVMTSVENAVVYDLEKHEYLEKPSFYSYDTVVESFLDTSMYSNELKNYFARYKELCLKERTPEENEEFLRAKAELEMRSIPSTELYIAFQNLEKQRKGE